MKNKIKYFLLRYILILIGISIIIGGTCTIIVEAEMMLKVNDKAVSIASGVEGSSSWELTSSGELHIGSGAFSDNDTASWGWDKFRNNVTIIVFDGKVKAGTSLKGIFERMGHLTNIKGLDFLDTSNTTSMERMFYHNTSLTQLDLGNFNTSGVTNMGHMFEGTTSIEKLDLRNFNTSKVIDMSSMFSSTSMLEQLELGTWDTSQVTTMSKMFYSTGIKQLDLSNFSTSNLTKMEEMFARSSNLASLNLKQFDTRKVSDMSEMFYGIPLEIVTLGNWTSLNSTIQLEGTYDNVIYTGKWQSLGTGSNHHPNGSWVGLTSDLIEKSTKGKGDVYVLQRKHRYVFTANDLIIKQSEVKNINLIATSKAQIKDENNPQDKFEIIVKDNGGLTSKIGSYSAILVSKDLPQLTKKITIQVISNDAPTSYQSIYRLYNPNTGEHFYTESKFEQLVLIKGGWKDEGVGWKSPNKGIGIYRLYNPNVRGGDHYYSASSYEAQSLIKNGWKWDNNGEPVLYSGGETPVYVSFNPNARNSGSHNYTINKFEQNFLLSHGWIYGKVQFYGK